MQADRTAAHGADDEEDPDDALPDWVGAFSKLAKSVAASGALAARLSNASKANDQPTDLPRMMLYSFL
jgi:hypothetical protein